MLPDIWKIVISYIGKGKRTACWWCGCYFAETSVYRHARFHCKKNPRPEKCKISRTYCVRCAKYLRTSNMARHT